MVTIHAIAGHDSLRLPTANGLEDDKFRPRLGWILKCVLLIFPSSEAVSAITQHTRAPNSTTKVCHFLAGVVTINVRPLWQEWLFLRYNLPDRNFLLSYLAGIITDSADLPSQREGSNMTPDG